MFWALVLDIGTGKTDDIKNRTDRLDNALIWDVIDCCKE
jgi:hypothetical protein